MKERIEDVDFIKGIMIYLMVLFHLNIGEMGGFTGFGSIFRMPVFLLFSGYFINVGSPIFVRLNKLFRTLIVSYIVFEILYILMLYGAGRMGYTFSNEVNTIDIRFVLYKIFIAPTGAYWYLHTMIIATLFLYLIESLPISNKFTKILLIGFVYFGFSFVVESFKFANAIFFLLGYVFKCYRIDIPKSLLALVGIVLIYYFGDTKRGSISSLSCTILVISFLKAFYGLLTENIFSSLLIYMGRNTLIVFLLHPFFLNIFKLFQKWFEMLDPSMFIYAIVTTTCTVFLSIISSLLLDKVGISGVLFGRKIYIPLKNK